MSSKIVLETKGLSKEFLVRGDKSSGQKNSLKAVQDVSLTVAAVSYTHLALVLFAYAGASRAGGNGYLSVYLRGIIVGNAKFKNKISMIHFFEGIDKFEQILIFFLLGLLVFPSELVPMLGKAIAIFLGLTLLARPLATVLLLTPFRCV